MLCVLITIVLSICLLAFQNSKRETNAEKVFYQYKINVNEFVQSLNNFKKAVAGKNEKQIQNAFKNCRLGYKKIECLTEYFYPAQATKINGPPIPLADELDMEVALTDPRGLQVLEGFLFPDYDKNNQQLITVEIESLLRSAQDILDYPSGTALTDDFIFDALIEEMYRITASGLTGFDTPIILNSLPETIAALNDVASICKIYESLFTNENNDYNSLNSYIKTGTTYISKHNDFNDFDRSFFIRHYLNPITKIICDIKIKNNFQSNPSPNFYASVNKSSTLFNANAFSVLLFTDDKPITEDRIQLGKLLFYEKRLSSDNTRACADCHQPGKGFTDGLPKSIELNGHSILTRNSPTIWNVGLQRNLFMDGRGLNLENQVIQVLNNKKEMNESAQSAALKIISLDVYKNQYEKIYPNASDDEAAVNIANAIACYERTLISLNAPFDKYMRGDTAQLNLNQVNGFNLFAGKARCATCHFIPLFNGTKPPRFYYQETEVLGVPETTDTINPKLDADEGRYLFTGLEFHKYSFKTPTLRNIELTAPYMHNGVYNTLEEVVDFYEKGGGKGLKIAPPNQTLPFDELKLTDKEKKDIVEFMKALTDTSAAY